MNVLIPSRFSIFNHDYQVVNAPQILIKEGYVGTINYADEIIRLQSNVDGCTFSDNRKEKTFFHELAHAILDAMEEDELNDNEQFVSRLGNAIHHFLKTARWDDPLEFEGEDKE